MTKAVLDLGTNTFHLLIGRLVNNSLQVLVDKKQAVKIGEKGINVNLITTEACQRAIITLLDFKNIIEAFGKIDSIEIYATSAFRNAENATEICDIILKETGFKVNIISGEEEAAMIFEGVKLSGAIDETENGLIIDIGGGSVEFIICTQNQIYWKESFEIGGLRLLELFHKSEPISVDEQNSIENYLNEKLGNLSQAITKYKPNYIIGASGAFDTFVDIYYAQRQMNTPIQATINLPIEIYWQIHNSLISKTESERLQVPGMIPLRAKMIVVGSIIIKSVIENYGINKITTSRYSLKEGAFTYNGLLK